MPEGTAHTAPPLEVLILARDEAAVLGATLRRLSGLRGAPATVHVVADHCLDETARVAAEAGARVHAREGPGRVGKGPALGWWLAATRARADPDGWVLVLDADSHPADDFFPNLFEALAAGGDAFQARLEPALEAPTALAELAAFSEVVEQQVYDRLRARPGWPIRLRGTGMAIRRAALEAVGGRLRTAVEDVELTLLLAASGRSLCAAPRSVVHDPKPGLPGPAARQRARWLRGLAEVPAAQPRAIAALLARGPAGWSLLSSVLLKPRSLFLPLKVALAVLFWAGWASGWGAWALAAAAVLAASAVLEGLGFAVGLRHTPRRAAVLRALLAAPIYLALWARSLALALVTRERWLRARPAGEAAPDSERKHGA